MNDLGARLEDFAHQILDEVNTVDKSLEMKLGVFKAVSTFWLGKMKRLPKNDEEELGEPTFVDFRSRVAALESNEDGAGNETTGN